MKRLTQTLAFCLLTVFTAVAQKNYVSEVWVSDLGNGKYKNPVLYADYSDPDACRVGDDFYMTSSSFNCLPGLQILHSKDLVNWTIIGAAVPNALSPIETPERPEHGNRVWAPAIRHHNGEFYIFWGDPDQGAFMVKAKDPKGPWSEPVLVKAGKGIIDTCPFWDEDGKVYMVHAYAGSRAGLKSVITICELNAEATKAITPSRIIFDGHEAHQTCEGPKMYKRNDYYYIFHPAGGVPTGWQVVLRSKNIYGPYEWKTVLAQGNSPVNGPHQGAWVDTPTGEDWFLHFQDVGAYGRIMHLQPMKWVNDWPIIGIDKDGDGCGEPVLTYKKPNVGKTYPICTPQESDEFDGYTLSPQWQWHANINEKWAYYAGDKSYVRLYSYPVVEDYKNLWDVANLLLQKTPSDNFTATMKLTFSPNQKNKGERPHQYAHHNQNHNIDHIFHDKCDRTDRCCDTEHKQNIENIGADHIAERHIQLIFARCNHRGHKLRQAGSTGNNRKSDQILAESQLCSNRGCAVYNKIPTELDRHNTTDDKHDTFPHRQYLILIISGSSTRFQCRAHHPDQKSDKYNKKDDSVCPAKLHSQISAA